MTVPALVKQADIGRAMREAKKHGAKKVHIGPDGSIDIILDEGGRVGEEVPHSEQAPAAGRAMFQIRPKKKVVL